MKYIEKHKAVMREPGIKVRAASYFFVDTKNPYFAWKAIDLCVKNKMPFPDIIIEYLGAVAEGMVSDRAKGAHDLRESLPEILRFVTKRGRGNLLDPHGNIPRSIDDFAVVFATKILHGEKPSAALKSASTVLGEGDRDADDKTLRTWLLNHFEQKTWLRTNAEWREVTERWYRELFGQVEELYREIAP
jgi:hypothetical protein